MFVLKKFSQVNEMDGPGQPLPGLIALICLHLGISPSKNGGPGQGLPGLIA